MPFRNQSSQSINFVAYTQIKGKVATQRVLAFSLTRSFNPLESTSSQYVLIYFLISKCLLQVLQYVSTSRGIYRYIYSSLPRYYIITLRKQGLLLSSSNYLFYVSSYTNSTFTLYIISIFIDFLYLIAPRVVVTNSILPSLPRSSLSSSQSLSS